MEPKVECTGNSMKLQVQNAASTPGSLLFVDRGSRLSPLPLSKLPTSCGYTIRSTRRDLVLVAPYDGCFVDLQEDNYILPLRWLGLPVKMSCPMLRQSSPNPPMVTCHAEGMVLKVEWTISVSKIKVNLNGTWEPLMKASPRCGFSVVVHPEGVVVSVRYTPCLEKKDGMYTLELAGDGETKVSCPFLSGAQPQPTKSPVKGPTQTPSPTIQQQPFYPYPFYVKPPYPDSLPPAPRPEVKPLPSTAPPVVKTTGTPYQGKQPFNPFPIYPQPPKPETLPEHPVPPKLPVSEEPLGQIYQPPQPEVPQGQVYQPFYPQPESQPATKPPEPEAPQGQVYQPFYPNPFYPQPVPEPQPATKPPQPQQPETPQGQAYQPFDPQPESQPATKPTAVPKPPEPEVPQGQVYQPFYPNPFYPQPVPEPQPATKPPQPQQPEAPKGQVYQPFYPNPFYPQPVPEPQPATKPPQPQQPETPQGQAYQPFDPQPESQPATKPTAVPKPPEPEVPQGQVYQPFYPNPFYPQPVPEPQPATKPPQPQQPEAPKGQVYQPFYPNPFYPQPVPEPQPATKPPQPQQPEAPQGQVYQPFFPIPYYSQPEPEKPPAEKLPAVPKPPASKIPIGQVQKPSNPEPFKIPGVGTNGQTAPTEKPAQSEQPPAVQPPGGQVPHPFNPYYYPQHPQHPQLVTPPPATSMQQPQQVTTPAPGHNTMESAKPQPSKGDMVPKNPLLGSAHMPPVYCPQSCPSGFSNCCPQIAFHQHLHHIVPAGPGSKDTPIYPGLPFLPSMAYSGFGNGFGSAPFPQKSTEAVTTQAPTTSTSAAILPQFLPSGNEKQPYLQPLDGNPAALPGSNPSKPTNPKQKIYPYFIPNSLYPNWPYQLQSQELQNVPYMASPPHYGVPAKPRAQDNEPVNPMVQFEPYNIQPLQQQNSKPSAEARSFLKRFLPLLPTEKGQNTPTAKELQPSNQKAIEYKGQTHPEVQSDLDHHLVPYYMLQHAAATTYNKSTVLNNTQTQPFVSDSKKSTSNEQGYVLLQHGPPGREPNSFNQSPLPVRDLVQDTNFLAQNFARHHSSKPPSPQNFRPPQEKTQHPKWLSKGMADPSPSNVNYMSRLCDESESLQLFFSASEDSNFVPLDPTFSGAHLIPKFSNSFKNLLKPMTPLGSSQTIPPHVPGKAFQGWRSAADHQGNGLNQPIQKEGGNRK
ncbi:uncharacterized protein LOC127364437 isoform X2 [Dicentrarchus labrax]|nr:uncharacterized protein LOC127364437 isoform X2 [Dicentrarchus labrax]